jgi:hypothetical protein
MVYNDKILSKSINEHNFSIIYVFVHSHFSRKNSGIESKKFRFWKSVKIIHNKLIIKNSKKKICKLKKSYLGNPWLSIIFTDFQNRHFFVLYLSRKKKSKSSTDPHKNWSKIKICLWKKKLKIAKIKIRTPNFPIFKKFLIFQKNSIFRKNSEILTKF